MSVTDADLDRLADQLLGLSGAEVAAVLRDARTRARAAERELTLTDLQAAADAAQPSPDTELLWRVCVHESGHVVAGHLLSLPPATSARVTPRGGEVLRAHLPSMTDRTVRDLMCAVLAGRAAEAIFFGDISSGGGEGMGSDLAQATELATRFEAGFGFGETLAWIPPDTPIPLLPENLRNRVEAALQDANRTVHVLLEGQQDLIRHVATALLERRELDADAIAMLFTGPDETCEAGA
jgi:cell division protease FtsH